MNQKEVEKRFRAWHPKVLILGTVKYSDGTWGMNSVLCETKQDVYKAINNFQSFDVFFLKKSKEGSEFYKSESVKYREILKNLKSENMAT